MGVSITWDGIESRADEPNGPPERTLKLRLGADGRRSLARELIGGRLSELTIATIDEVDHSGIHAS